MAYIDIDYYRNSYEGIAIEDDAELTALIKRASRDIDVLTRFQITDINALATVIQDRVKLATAMQVEHLNEYGEMAGSNAESSGGFSIGSYSESGGGSSSTPGAWSGRFPSNVLDVLFTTGLLYRGVAGYSGGVWCG